MVTHDLAVVAHLCEQVAVMQGGNIVEILDTGELARHEAQHAYTRLLVQASRDMNTHNIEKPVACLAL
jgi:peptide/nickel transport system ATP-binding protein